MTSSYALSRLAEDDVEGILDYIAADNPEAALSATSSKTIQRAALFLILICVQVDSRSFQI